MDGLHSTKQLQPSDIYDKSDKILTRKMQKRLEEVRWLCWMKRREIPFEIS